MSTNLNKFLTIVWKSCRRMSNDTPILAINIYQLDGIDDTCCNSRSFLSTSLTASWRSCISARVSIICKHNIKAKNKRHFQLKLLNSFRMPTGPEVPSWKIVNSNPFRFFFWILDPNKYFQDYVSTKRVPNNVPLSEKERRIQNLASSLLPDCFLKNLFTIPCLY